MRTIFAIIAALCATTCAEDYRRTHPDVSLDLESHVRDMLAAHETGTLDTGGSE